jgi:hypothetical protein
MPRVRLVAAVFLCSIFAASAWASPKSHEAAVKQFFKTAKMEKMFDGMAVQITEMQVQANPVLKPFRDSILTFLKKYMSWKELEGEMVKIYMSEFTEAEVGEMTKFYATPVGQKVLTKMPELTARGAALGQQRLQGHMAEFQQILAEAQKKNEEAAKAAAKK